MPGDSAKTKRELLDDFFLLVREATGGLLTAARNNALLILIVGLTGALSYESLFGLVHAMGWVTAAAVVFPLQLDLAGIPAYRLAADPERPTGQRAFGVLMVAVTLGGSVYGNLAFHLRWAGLYPTIFVSVVSPMVCAATLVIWHLPRVVAATRDAHRWTNSVRPTETSTTETQVTPEPAGVQDKPVNSPPARVSQVLHAVESRIPAGDWSSNPGPGTARKFCDEFFALNGREPETRQLYDALGPEYRARREGATHIRQARERRAKEEVSA